MPIDEIVRNSAPAIVGLLAAATGLLYTRHIRRQSSRAGRRGARAPGPAE
jgi:hypothetical protein